MKKLVIYKSGLRSVIAMDSVSMISAEDEGCAVVAASNGGMASGIVAEKFKCLCYFFNDAGFGKEDAGIKGIQRLDEKDIPAGTVSNLSARISDAVDTWENGAISALNCAATRAGFRLGERLQEALTRLLPNL